MQCFIEISDDAKLTIKEVSEYYGEISIPLKDRFEVELIKSIDLLFINPLHHQARYRKVRIAFTELFPYGIHYIVENVYIYVLKILHTKRFFK